MLNKHQFNLLSAAAVPEQQTQRNTVAKSDTSAESAIEAQKELLNLGYLNEAGDVTEAGKNALSPYRVDNAVILAAGSAARLAPLSFEKPKAMFKVRGEVLIERRLIDKAKSAFREVWMKL